jgi:hypothetical protein
LAAPLPPLRAVAAGVLRAGVPATDARALAVFAGRATAAPRFAVGVAPCFRRGAAAFRTVARPALPAAFAGSALLLDRAALAGSATRTAFVRASAFVVFVVFVAATALGPLPAFVAFAAAVVVAPLAALATRFAVGVGLTVVALAALTALAGVAPFASDLAGPFPRAAPATGGAGFAAFGRLVGLAGAAGGLAVFLPGAPAAGPGFRTAPPPRASGAASPAVPLRRAGEAGGVATGTG